MEKFFSNEFWETLIAGAREWIVTELPGLLIIIVVMLIIFKTFSFTLKKVKMRLIARAGKAKDKDAGEVEKRINTLVDILKGIVKIVLWTIFIMIALKKFGVDIGPILASVGIIGVAVGFGAQELVRDFISGFFILLENQVRTGDVAAINGTGGLVEKIEMRTITLRDFSGTVHVFQNGKINTLSNMTREWSAMVFDVGVAYKENVDTVMEVMREVGEDLQNDANFKKAFFEPIEIFGLDQFGDSALVIKARIKTKPSQQWTIGREYRRRLKAAFDARNIEIPFPHTTVYWGEEINPLKLDVNQTSAAKN
ncbi:small conductance mechanosensitive channel [Tangfeifania diversioriginum]|uniref:Small conductance mechanosensitive channel n=1 Tax=Tangfeifania diversioriginum TaxID=1168035 RepID=A0A1M6K1X3_9BACT|nr:mechanosensitive ion channel family protein [Tangfeifania diversioriginum]SHJ52951.1 small conductance mechanosensitive channel [Tangfeifania diversioriginum]